MKQHEHSHPCRHCGVKTPCAGELERNHDGEPPVICSDFHLPDGTFNEDFICEACATKDDALASEILRPA